jgi:hypothetical protein
MSFTGTLTMTITRTVTPAITQTRTLTISATPSHTITITNTTQPTVTYTWTTTLTPEQSDGQQLTIGNVIIYPNPCNPVKENLYVSFDVSQRVKLVKLTIYTVGYRKIKQITDVSKNYDPGEIRLTVENKYLMPFANGVYYVIIGVVNLQNEKVLSKPQKLIILK